MEFSNFEIAKGLHNLGHEVEVVTVRNRNAGGFGIQVNFPITLMPKLPFLKSYSLDSSSRANWIFLPVYCNWLKKRIDCFSPNVVFVADEASNCFWGSWAARMKVPYMSYCSVPFIAVKGTKGNRGLLSDIKFAANNVIERQFKHFNLKSYTSASWISVVSNSTRKEILGLAPWLEKRMDVIPRSIDDSFFDIQRDEKSVLELKRKLGINATDFVLLSVSNLEAGKGVDDVLRALALLRKENSTPLRYIVVGDGHAASPLKNLTRELGLNEIVAFLGNIPHGDLIAYYDICSLFILPSRRGKEESFGRVFVEAAARRKPSIGVKEGGMVDAIENRKTGFLVKAGDFNEIRNRIEWFLVHLEETVIMGQEARCFAEANFRSAKIARALAERLEWAAETNPGRATRSAKTSVAGYVND